jgi:hypothetical protein
MINVNKCDVDIIHEILQQFNRDRCKMENDDQGGAKRRSMAEYESINPALC